MAPINAIVDDFTRSGFTHASTAHREVWFQERGGGYNVPKWNRHTAVIVDEAAMLDSPMYARIMRQAASSGAKVILAGDDRQQGSVQRGGLFTEIKQRYGSVIISKVRRQQAEWQRKSARR